MTTRQILIWIATAAVAASTPAQAQFISGISPLDLSAQTRALTTSVINKNAMRGAGRPADTRRSTPIRRSETRFLPSAELSDARFPFQTSAALRAEVENAFLSRANRNSAEAKAIAAEFRRPEFRQSFAAAVRPYGFSPNDAADVMAVYLVTGWEIVHGTDANPAALRAVRRQVAGQMARNAALQNPAARSRFAEELKIVVTLLGGSVDNARREGNAAKFAAAVAAHYLQNTHIDLRAARLTPQGLSEG